MSFNAGAITGTIGLDTSPLKGALGDARRLLGGFSKSTERSFAGLGTSIAGNFIGNLTAGLARSGIDKALGGLKFGVQLAAQAEQSKIAFTTMLGSAKQATKLLTDLQEFAKSTPFQFTGLKQSSKLFLAMGFNVKKILPTMRAVGDVSAALSLGDFGLQHIIMILGQIKSTGTVHAQDMLQLTQMGIPAWDLMAQAIGKSVAQTKALGAAGKLSAKSFIDAFVGMRGPLAKFRGLMEQQSHSLGGLWSNFKDAATQALRQVGQAIVKHLNFKEVVANMTANLSGLVPRFIDIADHVLGVGKAVGSWAIENRKAIASVAELTAGAYVAVKAMAAMRAVMLGLTSASKIFMAGGLGLIAVGLGTIATAFIRAKVQGRSFGQEILRIADNLGLIHSIAFQLQDVHDALSTAGKRIGEANAAVKKAAGDPAATLEAQINLVQALKDKYHALQRQQALTIQSAKKRLQATVPGSQTARRLMMNLRMAKNPVFLDKTKAQLDAAIAKANDLKQAIKQAAQPPAIDPTTTGIVPVKSLFEGFTDGMKELAQWFKMNVNQFNQPRNQVGKQTFGEDRLASLSRVGSAAEKALQYSQARQARGEGSGRVPVARQQLDEQKESNQKLDELTRLFRAWLQQQDQPTFGIGGGGVI